MVFPSSKKAFTHASEPVDERSVKMRACLSSRAFTLVELLVVIAIVGLLSTIVLAVTSGVSEQGRIAKNLQFSKHLENTLGDHLVGKWSFDETANLCGTNMVCDTSGWSNHGTMNNFISPYGLVTDTPSGQGKAMNFDGGNDYVDCGDNSSLNIINIITVETWFKTEDVATKQGIVSKDDDLWHCKYGLEIRNQRVYGIFWINGTRIERYSGTISSDIWMHTALVFDGSKISLYLDGELEQEYSFSGSVDTTTEHLYIGNGYQSGVSYKFNGLIDEVRIYNTALTAFQIQSQYYVGLQNLLAEGQITEQEYSQRLAVK